MTNFKIIIVLPHLTCGGTERTAAELANYIAEKGGNVTILLMYKDEIFYKLHPDVKLIEPNFSKQRLGKYFYIPVLLYFIRNQLKTQRPDVVFALGYIAFLLFSSLGLNTNVIVSYRSNVTRVRFPNNKILNYIYLVSQNLMKNRINGIIAQTKFAEAVYRKKYNCQIETIPNFLREIENYKIEKKNQIINIGHCSFEKGQQFLIKAFAKLNAPDWKLIIIGDGPRRKQLEQLSVELGVNDKVVFTGYQKDVDYFLASSKIFAFTSIIEGYPNALIEAMATPLVPVSFNCEAGPSDIINDGENGFLVEVGNIEIFAARLQELIDQPELRERMQQKASIIRFENNLLKIAPKYLQFFYDIAKIEKK